MPAAREVIREYAYYYAFVFNLDIARPGFERTPDWAIVTGRNPAVPRWLNCAATACPDQGTYNDCGNMDPFHRQCISQRSPEFSRRSAKAITRINQRTSMKGKPKATGWNALLSAVCPVTFHL
jgi:hypothetical protein